MNLRLRINVEKIQKILAAGGKVEYSTDEGRTWDGWAGTAITDYWYFRQAQPKYYPFNLERALKGDPVVTRDGTKVDQLIYCAVQSPNGSSGLRLIVSINGRAYYYYDNGIALTATGAPADLVMVAQYAGVNHE